MKLLEAIALYPDLADAEVEPLTGNSIGQVGVACFPVCGACFAPLFQEYRL
jgi:hypothetical protein